MARQVKFVQGCYYHIYNRGVNRQPIFRTEANYIFLLSRVKRYARRFEIAIIAYCLMPNHYHFLVRQDGLHTVSAFVQAVFNSYTKAFNKMFGRSGTLFEGPFRAILVDRDEYLVHLCRYIHRNPLDAGLVNHPAEWPFSNYREWVGARNGTLVDQDLVQEMFPTPEAYEHFVMEYEPPLKMRKRLKRFPPE